MNKNKIVFILGAGASKTISTPLQSELINCIFKFKPEDINYSNNFINIDIDKDRQELLDFYDAFNKQRIDLADFIINNFVEDNYRIKYLISETNELKLYFDEISKTLDTKKIELILKKINKIINYNKIKSINDSMYDIFNIVGNTNVTLEDIFTLFDKIIVGREHFRMYSLEDVQKIHNALCKCIIFIISYYNNINISDNNPLKKFAEKLIELKGKVSAKNDNLSIITMNWDAYLEKILFQLCEKYNKTKKKGKIYPDLCFYDYCYNGDEKGKRVVSTQVKPKGYKNIKILKLHGSINWLICPYCGRVFVDYKRDIAVDRLKDECYCPLCRDKFNNSSTSPQLHSILITPTFMKDLNNLNIKNIWHNALLELTEASKVIFIGYSFPDADFEMRCLLKKAIMPETKIDVVLDKMDDPKYYRGELIENPISDQMISRLNLPQKRYDSFFCKDKIDFYYNGMEEYLQNHF